MDPVISTKWTSVLRGWCAGVWTVALFPCPDVVPAAR
jgi:hypothetical protein